MAYNDHESVSPWMSQEVPIGQPLLGDLKTEVCVVGAGIAGLTTAYLLAREGKKVAVMDEGHIGNGQTSRSTAQLSNAIDARYYEIERLHGEPGSILTAESHTAAIDLVEEICERENISCDFRRLDGYLFVPDGESWEILDKELQAAHRAGLWDVEMQAHTPIEWLTDGACLRFPNQAQLNPVRYLNGLARAFVKSGGKIYTNVHVVDVAGGEPVCVSTKDGHKIVAKDVVVATNTPINDRFVIHTKQTAYRTYVGAYEIPVGSIPSGLYWDTLDPYHYIRMVREGYSEFLLVGGEDHRTGQSGNEYESLQRLDSWTRERFPQSGERKYNWSGQIEETIDGLAYIGHNPVDSPHVYIATGDCGMGMTHGTIAAMLNNDLIVGRNNPWQKLYDPSRKSLLAMKKWIVENSNTVAQYGDFFKGGEVDSEEQIFRGEGAIVREGLKRVAVYKDENGTTHKLSPICPHLGGNVRWNSQEKSWDCPCHGSRFSAKGEVINGPATQNLSEHAESDTIIPEKEMPREYFVKMA